MTEKTLKSQFKSALAELRKMLDKQHHTLLSPAERYTGVLRREKATLIRKCEELEAAKRRMTTELAELPGLRSKAVELEQVRSEMNQLEQRLQSVLSLLTYERPKSFQSDCYSAAWEFSADSSLLLLTRQGHLVLWDMAIVGFQSEDIARVFIQQCLRRTLRPSIELHKINGFSAIVELCRVTQQTSGCKQMKIVLDVKDGGVGCATIEIDRLLQIHEQHHGSNEENDNEAA